MKKHLFTRQLSALALSAAAALCLAGSVNAATQNEIPQAYTEEVDITTSNLVNCNYKLTGNPANYQCAATPLEMHGRLRVSGTQLVDASGQKTILRGASLHGIQHTNGSTTAFKDYVNKPAFQILRDEWGVNLIRIPVYTAEGGYCNGNASSMDATIQKAVKYAKELGMYIIIDWHILSDGNPQTYQNQAIEFFKKYANMYKNCDNVLYEICNEPNGVDWAPVKSYAIPVIKTIRSINKNAVILVGTPDWSQLPTYSDSKNVARNPITEGDISGNGSSKKASNVMYSIHFYSATHYNNIQENVTNALANGLPVFCTEFGICDASGNGNYDINNANSWMKLLTKNNISFCCWNLSNNNESSSMFVPNCTKLNGWQNGDLTTTGAWFINTVRPLYEKEIANFNPTFYKGVDYAAVYDFDYYVSHYDDIKKVYGNNQRGAIAHFVEKGMKEGRRGNSKFNVKSYANKYYDLRKAYKNDLKSYYLHYIRCGKKEGRVATGTSTMQGGTTKYKGVSYKDVYNVGYYSNKYKDLRKAFGYDDAAYIKHFVENGMKEGRIANKSFNVKKYRKRYSDLRKKYGKNYKKYYMHYIKYGKKQGRKGK